MQASAITPTFGYTNHCRTEICYQLPSLQNISLLQLLVQDHFNASAVVKGQVDAAEVSSNNFYVHIEGTPLLLRKAVKFNKLEHQQAISELLSYLNKENLPVPQLHAVHTEERPFLEDRLGGKWIAYTFIDAGHYVKGSKDEVKELGATIAKLHRAFQSFAKEHPESPLVKKGGTKPFITDAVDVSKLQSLVQTAINAKDKYSELLSQTEQGILNAAMWVQNNKKVQSSEGCAQILHNDLHPHNLLSGDRVTVVDFDTVGWGHPYHDIAFALHRLVRQGVYHQQGSMEELRDTFLGAYRSNSDLEVDPQLLQLSALNRCMRSLSWLLEERYTHKRTEWSSDIPKMIAGIEENIQIYNSTK